MKLKYLSILVGAIILGTFFRLYNLSWGAPFYFHPDERNIASLISSLVFHPSFSFFTKGTFAYGTFISYLVFFLTNVCKNLLIDLGFSNTFSQSVIVLRTISAISSIATIILVAHIGCKFWNIRTGIFAGTLTAFSSGLIQQAHFGTFESFIILMYVLTLWSVLMFISSKKYFYFLISAVFIAIASAAKLNSLILFLASIISLAILIRQKSIAISKAIPLFFFSIIILCCLIILLSPYYTTIDFKNAFLYEGDLVTGQLEVFYTGEFFNTTPIIFQLIKIYPFLLNPVLTIIFVFAFFYLIFKRARSKSSDILLLVVFYSLLFFPQAFLFAKWTRYITVTLPFVYLIIAIALEDLLRKKIIKLKMLFGILIFTSLIFSGSYFITAFVNPDTRIQASLWANNHIPSNSRILSEVYDLGITPFNRFFSAIAVFNFYELDAISTNASQLQSLLSSSNYIILPSQRVLKIRLLNKNRFPNGYKFYNDLLSGRLGYKKIYETPCDIFCKITYLGNPVFSFEETASVFDRPTVLVFKKYEI